MEVKDWFKKIDLMSFSHVEQFKEHLPHQTDAEFELTHAATQFIIFNKSVEWGNYSGENIFRYFMNIDL